MNRNGAVTPGVVGAEPRSLDAPDCTVLSPELSRSRLLGRANLEPSNDLADGCRRVDHDVCSVSGERRLPELHLFGPIEEQKRRALELRLASGDRWEEHDLLFPTRGRYRHVKGGMVGAGVPGRPQHPNALYVRFKNRLKECGLEGFDPDRVKAIRLHDLRHTAVSVLINEAGMRAEDVQRVVGHADLKTTQAYRAVDDEPANMAAAAFDEILGVSDERAGLA